MMDLTLSLHLAEAIIGHGWTELGIVDNSRVLSLLVDYNSDQL